jgi:two-component system nitrate/nitrite response regulator NarL
LHRILIVSDIRFYRDGLAEYFGRRGDITVVGTAAVVDSLAELVARLSPTIVLIDRMVPAALSAIRAVAGPCPHIKLIVLGVADQEDEILCCAEAGAVGYVTKDSTLEEMAETIHSTGRGELRCSPLMAAALLRRIAGRASGAHGRVSLGPLTARETEVLGLIEEGRTNKEIATSLCIEVATVKNHVHHLMDKLKVRHRAQAGAWLRLHEPRRARAWYLG